MALGAACFLATRDVEPGLPALAEGHQRVLMAGLLLAPCGLFRDVLAGQPWLRVVYLLLAGVALLQALMASLL